MTYVFMMCNKEKKNRIIPQSVLFWPKTCDSGKIPPIPIITNVYDNPATVGIVYTTYAACENISPEYRKERQTQQHWILQSSNTKARTLLCAYVRAVFEDWTTSLQVLQVLLHIYDLQKGMRENNEISTIIINTKYTNQKYTVHIQISKRN